MFYHYVKNVTNVALTVFFLGRVQYINMFSYMFRTFLFFSHFFLMNILENNSRNSFWKPSSNIAEATACFLCSEKPQKYFDNFAFYKENYPIFWSEFKDYYHPEEDQPSKNVFDIRFKEPEPEPPKQFVLPEVDDPDENETGFSIEAGPYGARDFWQGFTIEEPLELDEFSELVNEIALENSIRIFIDNPTEGFLFPREDEEVIEFPTITHDEDDALDETPETATRGRGRGRGGMRGSRSRGRSRGRGRGGRQ